jgi:hypothetical protein
MHIRTILMHLAKQPTPDGARNGPQSLFLLAFVHMIALVFLAQGVVLAQPLVNPNRIALV